MGMSHLRAVREKVIQLQSEYSNQQEMSRLDEGLRDRVSSVAGEIEKVRQESRDTLQKRTLTDEDRKDVVETLQECERLRTILALRFPTPEKPGPNHPLTELLADEVFGHTVPISNRQESRNFFQSLFKEIENKLNGFFFPPTKKKADHAKTLQAYEKVLKRRNELKEKGELDGREFSENVHLETEEKKLKQQIANNQNEKIHVGEVRGRLKKLGGREVTLETEDDVKINAFHLSAASFRERLDQAAAKKVTLSKRLDNGLTKERKGIAFDEARWKESSTHILKDLEKAKVLDDYTLFSHDGKVILLPGSEDVSYLQGEGGAPLTMHFEDLPENNEKGLVVLSNDSTGIYEEREEEALQLLLSGSDVLLFNFRGYGKSEGEPSKEGFVEDMRRVAAFANEIGFADEKICFIAECMSAAPASEIAKEHPHALLILNQSFHSYGKVVKDRMHQKMAELSEPKEKMEIQEYIRMQLLKAGALFRLNRIVEESVSMMAPGFKVTPHLKGREANTLILVDRDESGDAAGVLERQVNVLKSSTKNQEWQVVEVKEANEERRRRVEEKYFALQQEWSALRVKMSENENAPSVYTEIVDRMEEISKEISGMESENFQQSFRSPNGRIIHEFLVKNRITSSIF